MKKKYLFLLFIIFFCSCSSEQDILKNEEVRLMKNGARMIVDYKQSAEMELLETFTELLPLLMSDVFFNDGLLSIQVFIVNDKYVALVKTEESRIIFHKDDELTEWQEKEAEIIFIEPFFFARKKLDLPTI